MTSPTVSPVRFLQIHTLTPYVAALLNRDDVGMAKRLPFGGAERIRISSQCLKRHWRRAWADTESTWSLSTLGKGDALAVRSREIFTREIAPVLAAEAGADGQPRDPARIAQVLGALQVPLLGESNKSKQAKKTKKKAGDGEDKPDNPFAELHTNQVIVLGRPEIEFILHTARALLDAHADKDDKTLDKEVEKYLKEHRSNLDALKRAAGLDAALFGRMVTSDILARGDAAVHVAHAFTVHTQEAEPDYFTAVDDLVAEAGELGSGHINQSELTSGLFYGYVVIDLPLLISNLEGCARADWQQADRSLAGKVVEHLIHLMASVSPGAKLGATAPYGYAELIMAEAGNRQPRSLANAFLKPVPLRGAGSDLRAAAFSQLATHLAHFDAMYGAGQEQRRLAALTPEPDFAAERTDGVAALAAWAGAVAGGTA